MLNNYYLFLNIFRSFFYIFETRFIKFLKICVLPNLEKKNIWLRITFRGYSTFSIKTGFDLTTLIIICKTLKKNAKRVKFYEIICFIASLLNFWMSSFLYFIKGYRVILKYKYFNKLITKKYAKIKQRRDLWH